MKKLITAGAGILVIGLIVYISSLSASRAMESNDSDSYEYEYYYNDNEDSEGDNMSHGTHAGKTSDTKDEAARPAGTDTKEPVREIDTDESSLTVFINKEYTLPGSYVPDNLVIPDIKFYGYGNDEKRHMRKEAADALEKMFAAAAKKDLLLYGVSGYRSYSRQQEIYQKNIRQRGIDATNNVSAYPGHSEHQTGLAIDISCKQINGVLSERFADTSEGKWIANNCHKYGFIIRYPKDKEKLTGYSYEPWHIRYLGTEVATYIYENGLTLEEYYSYTPPKDTKQNIISDAATAESVAAESTPPPKRSVRSAVKTPAPVSKKQKNTESKDNTPRKSVVTEEPANKKNKVISDSDDEDETDELYDDDEYSDEEDEDDEGTGKDTKSSGKTPVPQSETDSPKKEDIAKQNNTAVPATAVPASEPPVQAPEQPAADTDADSSVQSPDSQEQ